MTFLKDWTACVCITLVVAVIFSLLMPKGKMSSFYKIVISLFVFISFIYPLKNTDFDFYNKESVFSLEDIESSNENVIEEMIKSQIQSVLNDNDIKNSSVTVSAKQADDSIEISSVSVAVSSSYDVNKVKEIIFEKLGINAEVHTLGD